MTSSFMKEFEHLKIQLEEIKRATNSFRNQVIGAGGFGAVYEGEVSHSMGRRSIVAMKRLNRKFGQGDPEFLKEIVFLSRYTHQNLISLLGFCDEEDEKVLVYEFASKGSLDRCLSDTSLTWLDRIKICLGAAKGLCYLHDPKGTHQRVIHCDIKSANILLDESLTAKVADFGLSKMGPANQQYSVVVTNALGTPGYCDPLFMTTYTLTKESDVYSFGVVLFEVLCGRLCYEYSNGCQVMVFVNMWKEKYSENKLNEIVFQHLKPQMDPTSFKLFSEVAFRCLDNYREGRPTMSIVVENLEKALEFQELYDLKLPEGYKEIINAAVTPLSFTSIDELDQLLSTGVFLNAGKTWFSRNDQARHYVMISMADCLVSARRNNFQYSDLNNSRFSFGCYSPDYKAFKIRAKTQFLSPLVTYRVNLVFKLTRYYLSYKPKYLPLKYTLNGEKKVWSIHLANEREDEWLKASLYQFTSHERTLDLEIDFNGNYSCHGLLIEGIELQPMKKVTKIEKNSIHLNYFQGGILVMFMDFFKRGWVRIHNLGGGEVNIHRRLQDALVEVELHQELELKYGDILKSATHPLIFKSEAELNAVLSKGVLFNDGKTWFSRNDKGVHYVLKSIRECLIQEAGESYHHTSEDNSRFLVGPYKLSRCRFKACVKTEFLSPLMTYTVNLVFKFEDENNTAAKQGFIWLYYKLDGEMYNQVSHLAYKRESKWWTVELYHFTSDRTTIDLEIIFEGSLDSVIIEGIEFEPLEKEELQVLADDQKHVNLEPSLSDLEDDTYYENKLPTDYKQVMKFSKQGLQGTTNKELYYILSKGLLINYKPRFSFSQRPTNRGQQWFCLDKNGKTCLMLPARAICILKQIEGKVLHKWKLLPESRFGEGLVTSSSDTYKYIIIKKKKLQILSPQTEYACYLVYKTEGDGCTSPMLVWHNDLCSSKWEYGSHIYLVSPQTPVLTPKAGQNTHNPRYRPKLRGIPQRRSDGWMEVEIWKFQTDNTMIVIPSLRLEYLVDKYREEYLEGLIIMGIEFRPI